MKKISIIILATIFAGEIMNPTLIFAASSKNGINIIDSDYEYYEQDYIWEEYYENNYNQYYYEESNPLIGYGYYVRDINRYGAYDTSYYGYQYYVQDMYQYAPEYIYNW